MNTCISKEFHLPEEESLYLSLCALYEECGYRKYRMNKFEEYSLYLDHKNFLTSPSILTFTEPGGKLLALRPDVTLSIVKNTKGSERNTEKLYYRENVYRLDKGTKSYREIGQIGVEAIGTIDMVETAEIVTMAAKSLSVVDTDFVLSLSHTGFTEGLLEYAKIESEAERKKAVDAMRSQNTHELSQILNAHGISDDYTRKLSDLMFFGGDFSSALQQMRVICMNAPMERAYLELSQLDMDLRSAPFAKSLRLDLTVQSDLHYYDGLIMQGYVRKCPKAVLTGGRYDRLLQKFSHKIGAMGFALFLGEILSCYPSDSDVDFDVLVKYSEKDSFDAVEQVAASLRKQGKRVRIAKSDPVGLKWAETVTVGGKSK